MSSLSSIPLDETIRFLTRWLPPPPARVLDIGCGTGGIAAGLTMRGYQVEALDTDGDAVAAARERGVNAAVGEWPSWSPDRPSAILFVRTLHHMHDLDLAINSCFEVLPVGGAVLVEDFAFAEMPAAAHAWFSTWVDRALDSGLLLPQVHPFVACTRAGRGLPQPEHGEHSPAAMEAALAARFDLQLRGAAPYFYRYLSESLVETAAGYALLDSMRAAEANAIEEGLLWPLGRRWVAVKALSLRCPGQPTVQLQPLL